MAMMSFCRASVLPFYCTIAQAHINTKHGQANNISCDIINSIIQASSQRRANKKTYFFLVKKRKWEGAIMTLFGYHGTFESIRATALCVHIEFTRHAFSFPKVRNVHLIRAAGGKRGDIEIGHFIFTVNLSWLWILSPGLPPPPPFLRSLIKCYSV